jgi:hypothetical protein
MKLLEVFKNTDPKNIENTITEYANGAEYPPASGLTNFCHAYTGHYIAANKNRIDKLVVQLYQYISPKTGEAHIFHSAVYDRSLNRIFDTNRPPEHIISQLTIVNVPASHYTM